MRAMHTLQPGTLAMYLPDLPKARIILVGRDKPDFPIERTCGTLLFNNVTNSTRRITYYSTTWSHERVPLPGSLCLRISSRPGQPCNSSLRDVVNGTPWCYSL